MRVRFYPDELKDEAIRLVVEHRLTTSEAASKLGLRTEVVRVWVHRSRYRKAPLNDIEQLRSCVKRLAMERDAFAGIAADFLDKAI